MTDTLTRERRSALMRSVRGAGTLPERAVRSELHRSGLRFAYKQRQLPGRPDIVLPAHRTIVFVHGCFWHGHAGCLRAKPPKTNVEWWQEKVRKNRERDARVEADLRQLGWRVFTLWTCTDLRPERLRELVAAIREGRAELRPGDFTGNYRQWEVAYGA